MNLEKSFSAPTITESGVRRIEQSFIDRVKRRLVPYMTRKHSDEKKEVDPSQVTWRGYMTAVTLFISTITAYIAAHSGTPDMSGVQGSIDRLSHRMEIVEEKVDMMRGRVDVLQSAVNGLKMGAHL